MKILLIEDNADSRRNLSRLIGRSGHAVTACATAEDAEAELAQSKFPLLILDWMLPGKSGIELCRDLRALPNGDEMYILLVTARANPEDLQEALDAGANDYLTKPFDVRRLNVRLSVAGRHIAQLQERNQARSELLKSVKRTEDILEKTSDGFLALDCDWNLTYCNTRAEKIFKKKREEVIGRNLWETYPQFIGSAFEENFRQAMEEQVAREFEMIGENRLFEARSYPSGDGISIFLRDITERRRVEDERLTTSKLESLGTLAGGIAHDMNNVLTVISGNIGLAQLEAPPHCGNLLSFLGRAGQAAQQAARLSGQLLTFSKGGAPLKKVAAIDDLLARTAEFSLHGSNLRARVEIEDHLGKAEIDLGQLEQVMNALIINAREAMVNGGTVCVSAATFHVTEDDLLPLTPGRYIKVAIADSGHGVPPEIATKIFDPYFTTKSASSGLGLSICYSIIKKHGGFLHLENDGAPGATFSFYLPTAEAKVVDDVVEPNERDEEKPNQQRVLVMDDEAAIRELTTQLLSTMGYEVTAVPDGLEAIRAYEKAARAGETFEAVILDATVRGGIGGVETIARLRSMDPEVNAIICSGYSDAAAISQFLSFGFRGALSKPFTRRELADVLEKSLAGAVPA